MNTPNTMRSEADHAIDVAKAADPSAAFWRGDVRSVKGGDIVPGGTFNLVDDSNPNDHKIIGQFRALTMTYAPEGYTAIVAVASSAVPSQIPTVLMSYVIKSTMVHQHGVMGQIVPAGSGYE